LDTFEKNKEKLVPSIHGELKHATITKTKVAKLRAEQKTIVGTANMKAYAMLPQQSNDAA